MFWRPMPTHKRMVKICSTEPEVGLRLCAFLVDPGEKNVYVRRKMKKNKDNFYKKDGLNKL